MTKSRDVGRRTDLREIMMTGTQYYIPLFSIEKAELFIFHLKIINLSQIIPLFNWEKWNYNNIFAPPSGGAKIFIFQ